MLIHSTVTDAARTLGGSEETIEGLLDRWIERAVDWGAWERPGVIGLDEIALKRGHRDVVVLVTLPLEGEASRSWQCWQSAKQICMKGS
jgi:transposase